MRFSRKQSLCGVSNAISPYHQHHSGANRTERLISSSKKVSVRSDRVLHEPHSVPNVFSPSNFTSSKRQQDPTRQDQKCAYLGRHELSDVDAAEPLARSPGAVLLELAVEQGHEQLAELLRVLLLGLVELERRDEWFWVVDGLVGSLKEGEQHLELKEGRRLGSLHRFRIKAPPDLSMCRERTSTSPEAGGRHAYTPDRNVTS